MIRFLNFIIRVRHWKKYKLWIILYKTAVKVEKQGRNKVKRHKKKKYAEKSLTEREKSDIMVKLSRRKRESGKKNLKKSKKVLDKRKPM